MSSLPKLLLALAFALPPLLAPAVAEARGHVLKFNGVPPAMAPQIRKRFPYVFEREVSLSEIDEVVRFLMKSAGFSNVEVVEREAPEGGGRKETVLIASVLRRVREIQIRGNGVLPSGDIVRMLGLEKGQIFERKHLLASAEDLRKTYEAMGYHNARVEIDFQLPSDSEVNIDVDVTEGSPVRISEVVVDTPNKDLISRLNRMGRKLRGRIVTDDELLGFQKEVGEYLTASRYLTARLSTPSIAFSPDRTQAKLTYVIENPWKFDFNLQGNEHFTNWQIIRALEEEKLAGVLSSPAPDMAERIRRMYQADGYANVEVAYNEQLNEADHELDLTFKITENPRVRIRKIEVTGQISRPEAYYAKFIRASSSDLIGSGYFNRKDVEDGSKRLITELQNQGYLRARIQAQRADYSPDKSLVTVGLVIDEGPLTQIRQIRFEGVESFPKAQLAELLKIKTGSALGLLELEESIALLKSFYRAEGFLEMRIQNENEQSKIVTYNEGNTQATVEFQIYEGPRVRVGTIAIAGNSFTKEIVISRELAFKTGDVLTPERIEETIFRLQKLGLFGRVTIRTLEEGTNIAERTVIVEVQEANPGTFVFRVGANNERQLTLRGAAGVAYRNINGTGRGVSLRVDPKYSTDPRISYVEHIATASYTEPYIFGDRNRGRINLTREVLFFEFRDDGTRAILQEANTLGLLVERDFGRHIRLTYTGYNFSNTRTFDRLTYSTERTQNIAKTGPLVEFDFRDDLFNPTKGSYSWVNLEYADPLMGSSDDSNIAINFVKATAAGTKYTPLFGRSNLVWVNQIRGGYAANISPKITGGIPSQEAFFLGGRSTIRGFDAGNEDERIPNKVYDLHTATLTDFRVRADSYFGLIKTELWFPIYGQFGGTVFYDGGAVFINQPDVTLSDPYRDSIGVGIRVLTPVGPFNLELGYKLDRRLLAVATDGGYDKRESAYAIHISIGSL